MHMDSVIVRPHQTESTPLKRMRVTVKHVLGRIEGAHRCINSDSADGRGGSVLEMNAERLRPQAKMYVIGSASAHRANSSDSSAASARSALTHEVVEPARASCELTGFVPEGTAKIRLR